MATFTYQPRNLLEDEMRFAMNVERMRDAAEQRQSRREAESRREQLFQLSLADAKRKNEIAARDHAFTLDNLDKAQQLARIKTDNALAAARDAQNLLAYQKRDYDPLAEGLGSIRAGQSFSQLPADQKEAVTMHFGEHGAVDGSGTVMDNDTVRSFALNPDASGKFDRFQGLRNLEWRGALTSSATAGVGKKGNKTGKTSAGDFSLYADLFTPTYNRLLAENMIPKGADRKETFQAAASIYTASEGKLTPEQALRQALGVVTPLSTSGSEVLGAMYNDRDEDDKKEIDFILAEFDKKLKKSGIEKLHRGSKEYINTLRDLNTWWDAAMRTRGANDNLNWKIAKFGTGKADVKSPVYNLLLETEYDDIYATLLKKEKELSKKYEKWYKWVKNPANATGIDSAKMRRNLISEFASPNASRQHYPAPYPKRSLDLRSQEMINYEDDFIPALKEIQSLRDALVEREARINKNNILTEYGE